MYWIFFKIDFLLVLLFWIRKISSIKKPIIKVTPNHPQHRLIDWFIKYWSFSTENPQKSSAQNTCWEGENMIEMIKWKFCLFRRFSPQIFVPTSQWCSRPPKVTSEKGSGMGGSIFLLQFDFITASFFIPSAGWCCAIGDGSQVRIEVRGWATGCSWGSWNIALAADFF